MKECKNKNTAESTTGRYISTTTVKMRRRKRKKKGGGGGVGEGLGCGQWVLSKGEVWVVGRANA